MRYLRHTPFHRQQAALGAEFVDRYGFAAAAQYLSHEAEHVAVREAVGIFDVYYQTMIDVQGADALDLLQQVTVNDLSKAAPGSSLYTSLCNESGGMIDDLTVFRLGPTHFWLCPTPSRTSMVCDWLERQRGDRHAGVVPLGYRTAYLSVQGLNSRRLLSRLTSVDLSDLQYFRFVWGDVADVPGTMIPGPAIPANSASNSFFLPSMPITCGRRSSMPGVILGSPHAA